jgi:hypothetical protein
LLGYFYEASIEFFILSFRAVIVKFYIIMS